MLMLEHLDNLADASAKAISNIKFDKIVVWDGGGGSNGGKNATAGFLQGLAGSLPPLLQMMRDIGGIEMPAYFGKLAESPVVESVAAVSVGIVSGEPMLDLCYIEDVAAEVDMNLVMTGGGQFVEVQGVDHLCAAARPGAHG